MENKEKAIWKSEKNFDNWELRRHRFAPEMLPVFFQYLRLKPHFNILDTGCGTGVLGRYLAGGLDSGKVTGVDISEELIAFANKKACEEGLGDKASFLVGDGYHLPFEAGSFDGVTDYTYLGVLSDTEAGLREMIRVCKAGGAVSTVIATTAVGKAGWPGDYPFTGNDRLVELDKKQEDIFNLKIAPNMFHFDTKWPSLRYPRLFKHCGLKNISVYSFAHCFSFDDKRHDLAYRRQQVERGLSNQYDMIANRREMAEFYSHGMTLEEFDELLGLIAVKKQYLLEHLESDDSWEWTAGMSFVVVGNKPMK